MTFSSKLRFLVLAVVLSGAAALVAGGLVAGLARSARPAASRGGGKAASPKASVSAVDSGIYDHFRIFRRARDGGDNAPANLLPGSEVAGAHANTALARRALTTHDGDSVFLAPGQGVVCLMSSKYRAGGCVPEADAVSPGHVSGIVCSPFLPSDVVEVDGIVPDGITDAQARLSDGSSVPLDVSGNAFVFQTKRTGALPVTIEWNTSLGHETLRAPIPADAGRTRCATVPGGSDAAIARQRAAGAG